MSEEQYQRPQQRFDAPLTEKDFYSFLPGIEDGAGLLPSEEDSYKSDANAVSFLKALEDGTNVEGWDLHGLNLKGADMHGGHLSGVNLSNANLMNANLSGADLSGADLTFAYLEGANLNNADLSDAELKGIFVRGTSIEGAEMSDKAKKYFSLLEWIVREAEAGRLDIRMIPKEELRFVDIRMLDLSKVNINDLDLNSYVLDGVNLMGTRIDRNTLLSLAQLYKTNMELEKLNEKDVQYRKKMFHHLMAEKQEELIRFSEEEKKSKQEIYTPIEELKRPQMADLTLANSFERPEDEDEKALKVLAQKEESKEALAQKKEAFQKQSALSGTDKPKEEAPVEEISSPPLEEKKIVPPPPLKKEEELFDAIAEKKKRIRKKEQKKQSPVTLPDGEDEILNKIESVSILTVSKTKPKKKVKVIS